MTINEDRKMRMEQEKKEMERRSLDQLKVFNPLDEDRTVIWDGFMHPFPAKKDTITVRYLAKKFIRETIDYMINLDEQEAVDKENAKRQKAGHQLMTGKERETFANSLELTTSNDKLRAKYMKMVYKGLVKNYGFEPSLDRVQQKDTRPADVRLMEQLDEEMPAVEEVVSDDDKKKDLERSISETKKN